MASLTSASTYSKVAYDYILDALQRGAFVPGQDISEATIAATLDISRVPVREAIIRLQNEGYLDIFPKKGTFVAKYSFHEILDIYNIRLAQEPQFIARSCEDLLPAEIEKLREFRAYNQKYVNNTSYVVQSGEFFVQDINLHLFLFTLPKSNFFEQISTMALTRCIIAKAGIYHRLKTVHSDIAIAHIQLIDALCDGNKIAVEQAMYAHLSKIRDDLVNYYTKR